MFFITSNLGYYYWVKAVNERVESDFSDYDFGWRAGIHVYPEESIQTAIANSSDNDVIVVHQGVYTENINFSGKSITIKSTDPDDPNVVAATIIDGNRAGSVVTFNQGEGNDSVLEGVTIQNGYNYEGGGIYFYHSSPTISKCTIVGNEASSYGGGMEIYSHSSPIISQCTIKDNYASSYGGGIECWSYCTPTFSNCIISDNSTDISGSGAGGGIDFFLIARQP